MAAARSESDLRSLDRARMYTIFKPLDTEEPLTREQVLAAKRFRTLGRWELAGAIWLPLLVVIMLVGSWIHLPSGLALSMVGLSFVALLGFAVLGDRIRPLK